ncbi:hemicentin-1-like isoform X1 [Branchiostoma floridae]|uniref:Hemicentin-1-like isoform X1 n=2 Tax=Branchiostoma floridae TaxID=7739 RepID=A0A9J7MC61_BRAFL|nr:hemicentin-1-like isoform X1 [Branchiostoma floridae]
MASGHVFLALSVGISAVFQVTIAQDGIRLTLPTKVNAIVGADVVLPATYTTNQMATVTLVQWSKIDPRDPTKRNRALSYNPAKGIWKAIDSYSGRVELEDQASLRLERTSARDAGKFVLEVMTDDLQTMEGSVELVILVPPKVVVGPSKMYVVTRSKTVTLSCSVMDGYPNITSLMWKRGNVPIDTLRLNGPKYSGGNLETPSLTIRYVDRMDAGIYACVVRHPASTKELKANLTLRVLYPASVTRMTESFTAYYGEHVTLQCIAEGIPIPNITWAKDGVQLKSRSSTLARNLRQSTLTIGDVRSNNSGSYKCTAVNSIGAPDTKASFITTQPPYKGFNMRTIAIVVGVTVGLLWLGLCCFLVVCYMRRRQHQAEKTKFAFYYNMGRRDPSDTDGPPKEVPKLPEKPRNPTPVNTGIRTMRKSKKGQGKQRRYARVLYPYLAIEENELQLEIGDVIEVLEGEDGGWCLGYLRGRIGLFPSNYVMFLSGNDVRPAVARQVIEVEESGKRSI